MRLLKLGSRRSLLAWAQSSWVAKQIEHANTDLRVELVGIETQGDRILDRPLSQIDGKEFFVKELDEALLSGAVDFTVHSMKDLSLERPPGIYLAAIPKRENPRDVILFGPNAVKKIQGGEKIIVGSSSPRRLENIPKFLKDALPKVSPEIEPQVEFLEIRGNVNTRLARIHEELSSSRYLDGVVLAFAGLIRLWNDEAGRLELKRLLKDVRWMVLPLRQCPTAPAQGALAIECRVKNHEVRTLLQSIHDERTAAHVARERNLLKEWGGGCHQKFGATCVEHPELGELFFEGTYYLSPTYPLPFAHVPATFRPWDGTRHKGIVRPIKNNASAVLAEQKRAVFVAHAKAIQAIAAEMNLLKHTRVWTSGVSSWFQLAKQGIWVEGCAEGLGFDWIQNTLSEPVLQLPASENWVVFTHKAAVKGWKNMGQVIATYESQISIDSNSLAALKQASHIFWSSTEQFEKLHAHARPDAIHACGPGRTAQHIRNTKLVDLRVFPSVKEWRECLV